VWLKPSACRSPTSAALSETARPGVVEVLIARLPHAADLPLPSPATPLERRLFRTGFSIAVPHGYECQLRPRSGLALKHGITLPNTPATIDSDYRGELMVALVNLGTERFQVTRGMRIAQMIIARVERVKFHSVEVLPSTARGTGGFGSSGT
jgi:dUTP pyrophosphatase